MSRSVVAALGVLFSLGLASCGTKDEPLEE